MEAFCVIWGAVNIISIVIIAIYAAIEADNESNASYALIYPLINRELNRVDMNLAGKIIVFTLFTLALLPGLVIYYVFMITLTIVFALAAGFIELFKKR